MNNPTYIIAVQGEEHDTIHKAEAKLKILETEHPNIGFMITYYLPQPQYKSWVPKWFIRVIKKSKTSNGTLILF